ncbi:MAG: hypothetical protein M1448_03035 [Candidatus Marsarchaeota archaeon]|nr:hypothetical protein [Candidatus Marsarchaeota archaeon]
MVRVSELYNYSMKELRPEDHHGKEPYKHVTSIFTMNGKRLVFVGGPHTRGSSSYTKFLTRILAQEKSEIILLEKPSNMTKSQLEIHSLNMPKASWGESDWLVNFARMHGIDFAGMDIEDSDILGSFVATGRDGMKLGIAFWTMLTYYSRRHIITDIDSKDLLLIAESQTALDFLFPGSKLYNLRNNFLVTCRRYGHKSIVDAVDKILRQVVAKYVGRDPLLELLDNEHLTAPYPFASGYELSRISAKWHAYRDKAMIDGCISALKKYNRVMAVAGSGHIMEMQGILEKELIAKFGRVKSKGWDEL